LESKQDSIKRFFPTKKLSKISKVEKNLIVAFDIPEKKRKYRDWLRSELIGFGFEQVQKSVWFGPALPKEFILYLDEIKLLDYVRFFKASPKDFR
jgi:DNA-binding transcriptional regulator PaaX